MRVNAASLDIRDATTSTPGTLNDLTTDLIMANNNNRTSGNTSYVIRHSIEEVNCSPSETIKGKCPQSANMYM